MPTIRCKVVLVGDPKVGKSALTQMFHSDGAHYPKNYMMTVGVEFCVKTVNIPDTNYSVELYLFDCAGQDIYSNLIPKYVHGISMVVLIYDVTSIDSFNNLSNWIDVVQQNALPPKEGEKPGTQERQVIPGVLIANKTDLEDRVVVKPHLTSQDLGNEFAQAHTLEFFEASALRGKDVDAPFNYLANQFYESYVEKAKKYAKK